MQFNSVADFVAMGGYGFYVWLSFGSGFLLLALLGYQSQRYHVKTRQLIDKKLIRQHKLKEEFENESTS